MEGWKLKHPVSLAPTTTRCPRCEIDKRDGEGREGGNGVGRGDGGGNLVRPNGRKPRRSRRARRCEWEFSRVPAQQAQPRTRWLAGDWLPGIPSGMTPRHTANRHAIGNESEVQTSPSWPRACPQPYPSPRQKNYLDRAWVGRLGRPSGCRSGAVGAGARWL